MEPPPPTPGTCQWVSKLDAFNTWLNGRSSLVLIYAEPWCGKSVLARYLVDSFLQPNCPNAKIRYHYSSSNFTAKKVSELDEEIFQNSELQTVGQTDLNTHSELYGSSNEVASDIVYVLDGIDAVEREGLSSFIQKLRIPHRQKRIRFLATTRDEDSIISLFSSSEQINLNDFREKIKSDVAAVVDQQLKKLNVRGDRERICHDLRLNATGQSPYLWVAIVFDVLGKLTSSNFQSKAWRQLMNNSQETFTIFQRLLTWPNGRFKDHEHPSSPTVKNLLDIHLRAVLGVRQQRSKFLWHKENGQYQHKLHQKALSDGGPTLAVIDRTLYAVWRGYSREMGLWWSKIEGGDKIKEWSEPQQIPNASTDSRPSIAATEKSLIVLWKVYGDQNLQFSVFNHHCRDDDTKSPWSEGPVKTEFGSLAGPAVTVLEKDNVYAAWRGTKDDDLMWRAAASFDKNELKFQGQYPEYIDFHTKDRPAMAACRGHLYLAWTSSHRNSDKQILLSSLEVGTDIWDQPVSIQPHCHSSAAPSLAKFRDTVYVAWRGKGDDTGIWLASCARPEEPGYFGRPQRLEGVATDCTPAIVEWEGKLVMAWKGGWKQDSFLWWGWGDIST